MIRNRVNNKVYIGQTQRSLTRRWFEHCWEADNGFTRTICKAIRKYGKESFSVLPLIRFETSEEANAAEQLWIKALKTQRKGYNISPGGPAPMKGRHHTEESKKKQSNSISGEKHPLWGKKHSLESKEKMRQSQLRVAKHGKDKLNFRHDVPASVVMILFADGIKRRTMSRLLNIERTSLDSRIRSNSLEKLAKENPEVLARLKDKL